MDIGRREFTAASVSVSALLAGCSALGDDQEPADESGSDGDEDAGDENGNENEEPEVDPEEESDVHEDESMPGEVRLSDEAEFHLEVVQETFSWMGDPPADTCHAHVMLANDSGAELTLDLTARVYDADGTELSSTTSAGVDGPAPGEDDAVYSLELNNCEATAEYELEVVDLEADGEFEAEETDDDSADESTETNETETDESDANETETDAGNETDPGNETDAGNESATGNETDPGNETDAENETDEDAPDSLRVTVRDEDGEPIDHATVEAEDAGLFGWGETRAVDDRGRVEFDLADGERTLTAEADGYAATTETVAVDGPTEHTMVLEAEDDGTNELTVFVQDGDGQPIDHATVVVDGADGSELREVDGRGSAAFALPDGEYELTAAADGYPTLEERVEVTTDLEYTATLRAGD